ncbi:ATP-binding cassette domain-containing protein [Treponema phagedenis]|uniref:ATP-binding cassette domain-containing protein n=1 Tax=Treponema phagedenis TaxID=162 RepID=UPI0011E6F304|nr:ATP-binding cassette domain-containing protein [Treponema phagedenis]QEK04113.1 ATP-binding cassette domain-containing protein [Treponema phagedenis]QEK09728.1 ATP-binding cassette domain-containing protein [Treponema phagedenis]
MALITVKNLTYGYSEATNIKAISDVNFTIERGEYIVLAGKNGSGKSTLAACLAGLIEPVAGSIALEQSLIKAEKNNPNSEYTVPIALIFQNPNNQIIAETPELDIAFGLENLGVATKEMHKKVACMIEYCKLKNLFDAEIEDLSTAEKQRLVFGNARILQPALLVADEPSAMLSSKEQEILKSFLTDFHQAGGTLILISHNIDEIKNAERVLVMNQSKLVFDGKPDELLQKESEVLEEWGIIAKPLQKLQDSSAERKTFCSFTDASFGHVDNFSAEIQSGAITAVCGESGIGKTQLLEIIAHIQSLSKGSCQIHNEATMAFAVQETEAALFEEFVVDDIAYTLKIAGVPNEEILKKVESAMNLVGLSYDVFKDRKTFSLSGGEKRKAALAGIFIADPDVVLMDNPCAGLDIKSRGELLSSVMELKARGKTVVFTTNNPEEIAIADFCLNLNDYRADLTQTVKEAAHQNFSKQQDIDPQIAGIKKRLDTMAEIKKIRREVKNSDTLARHFFTIHPLIKFLITLCFIVATLAANQNGIIVIIIAALAFAFFCSYPIMRLIKGIAKIFLWLAIIAALQYLLLRDLQSVILFLLRFFALYIPLVLYTFINTPTEIMHAIEDFLFPLKTLGIPVRNISFIFAIIFRFIDILREEAFKISIARLIRRGLGKSQQKKGNRLLALVSLFVPLILRTLIRADALSQAVKLRYYSPTGNTRYQKYRINLFSLLLLALFFSATAYICFF